MTELRRTSLYEAHKRHGGKLVDYSGWEMSVQFEGLTAEHEAVRTAAGIFDVSHMGEIEVKGNQAEDFVQYLVTNDISVLEDNQILYTFMCYPDGGVVDDLLVYKFNNNHYYLVVNASNADKDYEWMKQNLGKYDAEIINISDDVSEIAIQGPKAQEILQELTDTDLSEIKFFYLKRDVNINGANCLVSRTGYTGEDGFEIYLDHKDADSLWEKLMEVGKDKGLRPAGLGARDTLRFEVALPLYGNEISQDISPLEAGLGFFVKLNKTDFIGKDALVKQKEEGLKRKLVGFEMKENGVPRHGYEVMADGKVIGFVTTGYNSPSLKKNIGFALVDAEYAALGTPIEIKVRKRTLKAEVVGKKFYDKHTKK
ncbi:glycine cleavage system aminomethyltransferase GcvT [Alkaliphilus sp. MSJ-5]|uniref:Aminomethyltransferase n=1 Tax=Alkaliphilus flagellatus TaxID=2841507 RepID=A0ABS6G0T3_9FIRM|nr:glycine cleavage system aminomethyltransferase GcvT [Alkaliphilus flagellatus]MBU5675799.1 glycine cleavage system aminomethyltransferase GcvT [Alkaliphilus flagellatus]